MSYAGVTSVLQTHQSSLCLRASALALSSVWNTFPQTGALLPLHVLETRFTCHRFEGDLPKPPLSAASSFPLLLPSGPLSLAEYCFSLRRQGVSALQCWFVPLRRGVSLRRQGGISSAALVCTSQTRGVYPAEDEAPAPQGRNACAPLSGTTTPRVLCARPGALPLPAGLRGGSSIAGVERACKRGARGRRASARRSVRVSFPECDFVISDSVRVCVCDEGVWCRV